MATQERTAHGQVLVAIMNNQRDFHILQDQIWYRVPKITEMINRLEGLTDEGLVPRSFHRTPQGLAQQLTLFEETADYELDRIRRVYWAKSRRSTGHCRSADVECHGPIVSRNALMLHMRADSIGSGARGGAFCEPVR